MDLDSLSFTAEQAARALCLYWFSVPPNTMGLMQVKNTAWETLNLKRGMLAKLPSGERQHLFRPPPPHIIFIILVRKQIYLPTQWETFFFFITLCKRPLRCQCHLLRNVSISPNSFLQSSTAYQFTPQSVYHQEASSLQVSPHTRYAGWSLLLDIHH